MKQEIEWLLKEKYRGKPSAQFTKDMERLKKGEPLDYVIGFTDFLGCHIDLAKKPLIPRQETEYWVKKAIEQLGNKKHKLRILDMFAGSGCIGISIMRHIPHARVVFAEKDKKLIGQIKINCNLNKIDKKRYRIVTSDIFEHVKGTFDYIFANPPYIPKTRKNKIQPSVLHYEPKLALFGGNDGLFYIKKFLHQASSFLNPGGKIYMEFDVIQKKKIEALLKKFDYQQVEFLKDQYYKFRCIIVTKQ